MSMPCKVCAARTEVAFTRVPGDPGKPLLEARFEGEGYERPYYRCTECGLMFHTGFDGRDVSTLLPDSSPGKNGVADGVDRVLNRAVRELNIASNVLTLYGRAPEKARVLVYGCGTGVSFNLLLRAGLDAWGFDIELMFGRTSPFPAEAFDPALAPRMLKRFLNTDTLKNERFDLITLTEVFEHFTDPVEEMRNITRLLKPGGLLTGTTGLMEHAPQDLMRWWYVECMFHTTFVSRAAFQRICADCGVNGLLFPKTPRLIGNTSMSDSQCVFVMQRP